MTMRVVFGPFQSVWLLEKPCDLALENASPTAPEIAINTASVGGCPRSWFLEHAPYGTCRGHYGLVLAKTTPVAATKTMHLGPSAAQWSGAHSMAVAELISKWQ